MSLPDALECRCPTPWNVAARRPGMSLPDALESRLERPRIPPGTPLSSPVKGKARSTIGQRHAMTGLLLPMSPRCYCCPMLGGVAAQLEVANVMAQVFVRVLYCCPTR
jgi:hypothetical protein